MCWLAGGLLLWLVLAVIYRRANGSGRLWLRYGVAAAALGLQVWRIVFQIAGGIFDASYLPFHLCDLTVLFIVLHSLFGRELAGEFLYCLGMPGALSALLFPDWTRFPVFNIQSLQSFSIHLFMVAYVVMTLAGGDIRPNVRRLPKCCLLALAFCVPIFAFNKLFGTNFFFMNWPSAGSPLEIFGSLWGNPGYLMGYIPIVAVLWTVLYLPFCVIPLFRKNADAAD